MSMPDRLPVMGEQRPRGVPPAWSLCGASAAEVRSQCGQAGVLRGGHTQHTRAHIPTLKRMHTHACVPVHVHTCRHTCTHTGGWWQRSRGWSDVTTAKGLPHHQGWEGAGPPSRPCAGMLPAGTCVCGAERTFLCCGLSSCGLSLGPALLAAGRAAECAPSRWSARVLWGPTWRACGPRPCCVPWFLQRRGREPLCPAGGSFPGAAPVAACASSLGPHVGRAQRWA